MRITEILMEDQSGWFFVLIKDGEAKVYNEDDPELITHMQNGWSVEWDSARTIEDGYRFAKERFDAEPAYTDKYNPVRMTEPKVLYRSVSYPELLDIVRKKKIMGGGNRFNQFDGREWVFFGDDMTSNLIYQGEELARQVEMQLMDIPLQKKYRRISTRLKEITTEINDLLDELMVDHNKDRVAAGKPEMKRNEDWDRYAERRSPELRKLTTERIKLDAKQRELDQEYRAIFRSKYDDHRSYIDTLPFSSAVLETRPLAGGWHYSKSHNGGDTGFDNDEYGFPRGAITLKDITRIHLIKNRKVIDIITPDQLRSKLGM